MPENQPAKTFKVSISKELNRLDLIRSWEMLNRLEKQVDNILGKGNWYAVRYYSQEESDGSLTFLIDVVEHKMS